MRRLMTVVSIAIVAAMFGIACGPAAVRAQTWRQISSGGMNVSDQVGIARTSDGILHIVWRHRAATQMLLQTPIAASGALGPSVPVVSGWSSVGSPALVADGRALTVAFPGTPTLVTGNPQDGLDLATSADGGRSWSVAPAAIAQSQFSGVSTPAAVLSANGSYLQSWYAPEGTVVHAGVDPNVPGVGGYGQGIDQALAATGYGPVTVAWCDASTGVYVAQVDPASGARVSGVLRLSRTGRCPADTHVALGSSLMWRTEHSFLAASDADGRTVRVYDIAPYDIASGTIRRTFTVAGGSSFKQQIALAFAPHAVRGYRGGYTGGVWVGWYDSGSGGLVFRRWTNAGVWGATVNVPLPAGQSVYQVQIDAQNDRVDVIARTQSAENVVSLFATQVQPGLTLTAGSRMHIRSTGFRVLDAGRGVTGATVNVAGRRLTTTLGGYAKADLPAGSYKVTAAKAGYVGASQRVRLR